jgi:hypothetical protein
VTFEWVELGRQALALADGERIVGVLYWSPGGPAERGGPGGEPGVLDAGFHYVPADNVSMHKAVMDGAGDSQEEWDVACDYLGAYLHWSEAIVNAPSSLAGTMLRVSELSAESLEEGRALYSTLSSEDRAALDSRGLADVWRVMEAMDARASSL